MNIENLKTLIATLEQCTHVSIMSPDQAINEGLDAAIEV